MNKFIQSTILKDFYNEYKSWLNNGANEENQYGFLREHDLYLALHEYLDEKNIYNFDYYVCEYFETLKLAGLDILYPFGRSTHINEMESGKMYLNENQINWVNSHLTKKVNKHFTLVS